jgi:hypothetical protein
MLTAFLIFISVACTVNMLLAILEGIKLSEELERVEKELATIKRARGYPREGNAAARGHSQRILWRVK